MKFTRRTFLTDTAALLAISTNARAFEKIRNSFANRKKGLAGAAPLPSGLLTSWYYDWGAHPAVTGMPTKNPSMRFFPMIWGWNPQSTPKLINSIRQQHPSVLLGFNEPDNPTQSNIPVQVAIDTWPQFEGIAKDLVSPACAHPLGPWMQEFMRAVDKKKLHIDSIGVHNYPGPNADGFLEMLHKVHHLYGRPIWVTEFAVADWKAKHGIANRYTVAETARFMKTTCTEMNKLSWVNGYAWFPFLGDMKRLGNQSEALATSVLFDSMGHLTELGRLYATL
jgi:hypothetical protein